MKKPLIIMPCMDMIAWRVVKGVKFVDIKDAGDPVECCKAYCAAGADELAMLDITATIESRKTLIEVTKKVAEVVTVPFTMGGGVGQSRLCMLLIGCAHIGEVQSGVWDEETVNLCKARGVHLL